MITNKSDKCEKNTDIISRTSDIPRGCVSKTCSQIQFKRALGLQGELNPPYKREKNTDHICPKPERISKPHMDKKNKSQPPQSSQQIQDNSRHG